MPPRVYRGKSAYEYRPKGGGAIRLCRLDADRSLVWLRYEEEHTSAEIAGDLVKDLVAAFFKSPDYSDLSDSTRSDYEKYSRKILPVFGEMRAKAVKPIHVRKYMDKRGQRSRTQANREKAFFSRVFSWGRERDWVTDNPCSGVRKFKEVPRTRYITDEEYSWVYNNAPLHVRVAMEISYLCAARQADVLSLTWEKVLSEGIYIEQSKTKIKQIKQWSQRLKAALDDALKLCPTRSKFIIVQANGSKYSQRGFYEGWRSAIKKARLQSDLPLDFTFHDIKAKGISDFDGTVGEKQKFSGHKTERQVATYNRKIEVVPTIGSNDENIRKKYSEKKT